MGTNLRDGNIDKMGVIQLALDWPNVNANSATVATFTVPGVEVGDQVVITQQIVQANLFCVNSYVSAPDTIQCHLVNASGSNSNIGSRLYNVLWFRPTPGVTQPSSVQA
jgi:hypothetical protein